MVYIAKFALGNINSGKDAFKVSGALTVKFELEQ